MWVMTPRGFYSVVQHRQKPTVVLVRTRNEQDIRNLLPLLPAGTEPIEMQHSDYAWRVEVPVVEWVGALTQMALDINYDNFKSRVGQVSPRHAGAYHRVWGALLDIEDHPPGRRSATAAERGHWGRWDGYMTGYEETTTQGGGKGKGKKGKNRKAGERTEPSPTQPQLESVNPPPPRSWSSDAAGPDEPVLLDPADMPVPEVGQEFEELKTGAWWAVIEIIEGHGDPVVRIKRLDNGTVRRESPEDLAVFYDQLPSAGVVDDE